jgi:hypothetical protein
MNPLFDSHPRASAANNLLTTGELASLLNLRPQSIRKRYSQTGSYFRLRPMKLKNGRLLWPADAIVQLQEGGAA